MEEIQKPLSAEEKKAILEEIQAIREVLEEIKKEVDNESNYKL